MQIIEKYFSDFTEKQKDQFLHLKGLYSEWNEKINVISRKDMDHFYEHHVLHSLAIAAKFTFSSSSRVMDLGTGGGFPGLTLAIMFPETAFVLVDSIRKKLNVVDEIGRAIGMDNIRTLHSRAEDIRNEKFDVVTSRAVAPLKNLWNWSRPLLKKNKINDEPNGLICLKGGDLAKEIQESMCKPFVWEIHGIFQEEYFRDKYLLYQPAKNS